MKSRIVLLFLALTAAGFSQTNTAADPVFQTKAQKEAARKKAEQDAIEAAARAKAQAIADAKEAAERAEQERIETEKIHLAARLAAEAKEKERQEVEKARQEDIANLKQAFANDLADRWAKQIALIYRPARTEPGGWTTFRPRTPIAYGVVAAQYGMTLEELFAANGMLGNTINSKNANARATGEFWVWDKNCPADASLQDREDKRRQEAAKYVTENPPEAALGRPGSWKTYEVGRRDTLHKIAAHYRMALAEIHQANPATRTELITIAQRLWVWDDGNPLGEKSDAAAAAIRSLAPKVRFPPPLEMPGRWLPRMVQTTMQNTAGWSVADLARNQILSVEQFRRVNSHLDSKEGTLPHGAVFWAWETDSRRASEQKQDEERNEREEANEAKLAAIEKARREGPPPSEDKDALAKAEAKVRAEPRPWVIDKAAQEKLDTQAGRRPGAEQRATSVNPNAPAEPVVHARNLYQGARVYDINTVDVTPVVRAKTDPQYPFEMRRAGTAGRVKVDFLVDTNGDVQDAYALESTNAAFEPAALQALRTWKYKPGRKGGRDVPTHMQVTLQFSPGR